MCKTIKQKELKHHKDSILNHPAEQIKVKTSPLTLSKSQGGSKNKAPKPPSWRKDVPFYVYLILLVESCNSDSHFILSHIYGILRRADQADLFLFKVTSLVI